MGLSIPIPNGTEFKNGIKHPDLYLWDAWSFFDDQMIHLYCLAVNRTLENGERLEPSNRNNYPFHIRHFSSKNDGATWKDEGCFLSPRLGKGKHDSKTIWSGSIEPLPNGKKLCAYTGLYEVNEDITFLQNIALAISNDGYSIDKLADEPLSSPDRDYDQIRSLGYYVDPLAKMGHKDGEGGGPIMAWRDPYVFVDKEKKVHLFWAAKIGTHQNAMAHALLKEENGLFVIDRLLEPITLPDGELFTQLELPKIYFDHINDDYYLFVSTCNRLYEGQSDAEVDKTIRLYKSTSIRGPWKANGISGSALFQKENIFGSTVLRPEFDKKRMLCISPYSDAAADDLSLTFSAPFYVNLDPVFSHFV